MVNEKDYRETIVSALCEATEIFTSHSEQIFEEVVSSGLQPVAVAAGIDRVAVYRVLDSKNGRMGQIYVWAYGKTVPLDEELIVLPDVPPVRRWLNILTKGECVYGNIKEMDKDQAGFCAMFGIKSILFVPIFTHGEFWGVVTLEDHTNYRHFEKGCLDLFSVTARLCANAFIRYEMTQSADNAIESLVRRENLMNTLNKMAIKFLSQSENTFKEMMTEGIKEFVDIINVDRLSVWRNSMKDDRLHISQIYRWHRIAGGTTTTVSGFDDIAYKDLVPRWENLLSEKNEINGPAHILPEAELLKSYNVVSLFVTPIFVNNYFWGFVLFEDHENEREFDTDIVEMMRSAALLCANNVIRDEMEHEIVDVNEFNRTMSAGLPIGFTVFDDKLRMIDCNDAILKMLGTTKEYFLEHFIEFLPEYQSNGVKSVKVIDEVYKRVLNGEKFVFSFEHKSSSGEIIHFEISLTRALFKGKYLIFAYLYNISNIKKMEKDVADAESLTHAVTEASPIPYVLFDENLKPIDCNIAAMQIFGSPNKKFLIDNYWKLFIPEKQPDGRLSIKKARIILNDSYKNNQVKYEWMHKSLNGELIPMENTVTGVIHRGKRLLISYKYDLRRTRKMLEDIREQSELLKIRLEQQELISEISRGFISSGDSETLIKEAIAKLGHYNKVHRIIIYSIDYEQKLTNPTYQWIYDGSPSTLAILDHFSLIMSSFPERLPDCATLPVFFCDDVTVNQDKTNLAMLSVGIYAFIVTPLYVDGRLWGVLSVEQAYEPRKWSENEKGFVAIIAGTIGGIIMRNIYNTMLKEALEKTTIASRAKGEFLSNMSHEMRTPLNAIIGMTAIAKNAVDLERKNYALNKIGDASAHLMGVINDVLDMSKIEANKLDLDSVEFNFEKMLQKTTAVINFRIEEKHQKLLIHIDKAIPDFLVGDDQRISQVITNLLSNAVKFTPDYGSINLNARFLGEEDDLCTIQISITDTGIGISDEQQPRLFQSFHQAETSTVRKYGGTGLGLAISKSIVEMMGGKIWVESEINKGSVFSFTIQVKCGEGKDANLKKHTINWGDVRILAVDDDPDVLEFFKDISQRFGVYCDTAISGEDALRFVEKNGDYNVYFIDWKMPGIDGITLTGALKSMNKNPGNSVVIMISATDWNEIETEAKQAGIDGFIPKPLFPSAIADTICECLGVERQTKEIKQTINTLNSFEGHRILLVEDVEINREIVLTILEPMNLKIDYAENGLQAVRMFCEEPDRYEMIFMDVQMPEMDGYEATRKIRTFEEAERKRKKMSGAKGVPIIAMTANVFKEDIEKCLAAGMDDHIGKPLDFELIIEKLNMYLK